MRPVQPQQKAPYHMRIKPRSNRLPKDCVVTITSYEHSLRDAAADMLMQCKRRCRPGQLFERLSTTVDNIAQSSTATVRFYTPK